jgi:hypothetical protein
MDPFAPLLVEAFGPRWFETGSLSLYFRNGTIEGDPVQAIVERPTVSGADLQVRAWMIEPDGTVVAEGTGSVGNPSEPTAVYARDVRPMDPELLRILRNVHPGDRLGDLETQLASDEQRQLVEEQLIAEPLAWYTEASPWGGPIAAPSAVVRLLFKELTAPLIAAQGPRVGLFGAIEIRFVSGPVHLDRIYNVSGEVVAVGETPKTEVLWFDSWASDSDGQQVARMRMMLRQMKAASPFYPELAVAGKSPSSAAPSSATPN